MNGTTNAFINQTQELRLMYTKTEFASAIILTILSPVSVLANVLVLVAVYMDPLKCFRKPTTVFVLNLSVADLICGLIVEPSFAFKYYTRYLGQASSAELRKLAGAFYVAGGTISTATLSSSFLLVLQLSVVQYVAIGYPHKYKSFITKSRALFCVLATWVYFVGFSLLSAFAGTHQPVLFMKIHLTLHATLISTLLVIVLLLSYRAFRRRLLQRPRMSSRMELNTLGHKTPNERNQYSVRSPCKTKKTPERQFTLMTFYLAAVLLFSALPHVITLYIFLYKKPSSFQEEVYINIAVRISDLFLFLKVAADPFVFAWRLPDYRDSLVLAVKCKAKPMLTNASVDV